MYRLKADVPEFTVVEGEFANCTFRHGELYEKIPPGEAGKFEEIKTPA